MRPHEAFLKAIRVQPNEPWHEQVYGDFLRDEGYDPPDDCIRQARALADLFHSAQRTFRVPYCEPLGAFGLELLLSCSHLDAMQELYLAGRVTAETVTMNGRPKTVFRVVPNIGERGVVRLVHAPLMKQITHLDVRFNNLGEDAFRALMTASGLDGLQELFVEELESPFTENQWDRLKQRFGARLKRPRRG